MPDLHIAQDEDADRLLSESPLALLVGMALDQQSRESMNRWQRTA